MEAVVLGNGWWRSWVRKRKNVWQCGEYREMLVVIAGEVIRVLGEKNVKEEDIYM